MREEETVFVHVDADLSADFDRLVQCRRTPTPSPPPSWHNHDDVRTDEMDHQQQQQQLQRTPDACKEIKSSVRRQHIRAERCRCPIAHTVVLYARSGTSPPPPPQHDGVEDVVVKDDAQQHNDVQLFVFVDVRQAKRLLAYRGAPPPGVSPHDTTPAVMGYLQRIATCATRAIPRTTTTTTTSSSHVLVHIIVAPRVVAAEVARTTTTPTTSAHLTAREHALFLAAVASWGGELLHATTNDDGGCVRLGIVESVIDATQAVDRVLSMMKKMLQRPHTTATTTTTSLSQHGMLAHATTTTTTTATASRAEVLSMCAEDERASAAAVWECVRPDCNTKADATDHRVLFRSMLMEVWSYSEMKILAAMRVFPTMHSLLTCVDELVKRPNNNNNNNNMLLGADADVAARMKVMASALDEDGRSYNVLNDAMVRALTADYRRLLFPEGGGGCDDDG